MFRFLSTNIRTILLWPVLFLAQLIFVVTVTIVFAGIVNTKSIPSPSVAAQFTLALTGIPLAMIAYRWKPLRSSGKWIWIPGVAGMAYDAAVFGPGFARQEFFSPDTVGTAITIVTAACVVYSLTLLMLPHWDPWKTLVGSLATRDTAPGQGETGN